MEGDKMLNEVKRLTEKQKKILEVATVLFAEKGYASTSTSEIAKKAGVAEGTIFRHYKSKKELLITVVSPVTVKLIAPMVKEDIYKVLDQDFERFEDFLRAMIENRTAFLKNNLPLLRILFQELPFHPEIKEEIITHIGKDIFKRMGAVVEHYQEKGQITFMHTTTLIRTIASTLIGYIVARHLIIPEAEWDDEAEVERIIQIVMYGISMKK
jgi:AcrR family transcriptional regulator